MKTIKFTNTIILFAALGLFSTCKKDESKPVETPTSSKVTTLTAKDWMITAATMTSPSGTLDIYSLMDACDKDDLFKFNIDKTILLKSGATKCDPTDPNTSSGGIWALIENESKLQIIDDDTTILTLITLNSTTLKGSEIDNSSGTNQTITFTFTAQ